MATGRCLYIAPDVFDEEITDEALDTYLHASGHALWVAMIGDRVVGQIRGILHYQPDAPTQLYIDNLGVSPSYQRRGIATQLIHAILAWGRGGGCTNLWVATEMDNYPARELYATLALEMRTLVWYSGDIPAES